MNFSSEFDASSRWPTLGGRPPPIRPDEAAEREFASSLNLLRWRRFFSGVFGPFLEVVCRLCRAHEDEEHLLSTNDHYVTPKTLSISSSSSPALNVCAASRPVSNAEALKTLPSIAENPVKETKCVDEEEQMLGKKLDGSVGGLSEEQRGVKPKNAAAKGAEKILAAGPAPQATKRIDNDAVATEKDRRERIAFGSSSGGSSSEAGALQVGGSSSPGMSSSARESEDSIDSAAVATENACERSSSEGGSSGKTSLVFSLRHQESKPKNQGRDYAVMGGEGSHSMRCDLVPSHGV